MVMLLGLLMGFLYSTSNDPAANVPLLDVKYQTTSLQSLRAAKIDEAIINSETFKSLRIFGSLPVIPAAGVKSNPFQ